MATNLFLSIYTLFTNDVVQINVHNTLTNHVYNIEYTDELPNTNSWYKSWLFVGTPTHSNYFLYYMSDATNRFFRVQDRGALQETE